MFRSQLSSGLRPRLSRPLTALAGALLLSCATLPAMASTAAPSDWWTTLAHTTSNRSAAHVSVRSYGALGNGVHNDTAAFQAAVDALPASGGTVDVPAGVYMIDAVKSVRLRSHTRLLMSNQATLQAIPNSNSHSYVLRVWNVQDVRVAGGNIVGERARHQGSTGEWGMGISVLGSSYVSIAKIKVSDCWGDGVYVGNQSRKPSDHVILDRVVSDGNRRQGLSITPASYVYVLNSSFTNTHGTLPQDGIDIEPMSMGSVNHVRIENTTMAGNKGSGIEIRDHVNDVVVMNGTINNNTGYGLSADSPTQSQLQYSLVTENGLMGVSLRRTTADFTVANNVVAYNSVRYVKTVGDLIKATALTDGHKRDMEIQKMVVRPVVKGNKFSP